MKGLARGRITFSCRVVLRVCVGVVDSVVVVFVFITSLCSPTLLPLFRLI